MTKRAGQEGRGIRGRAQWMATAVAVTRVVISDRNGLIRGKGTTGRRWTTKPTADTVAYRYNANIRDATPRLGGLGGGGRGTRFRFSGPIYLSFTRLPHASPRTPPRRRMSPFPLALSEPTGVVLARRGHFRRGVTFPKRVRRVRLIRQRCLILRVDFKHNNPR